MEATLMARKSASVVVDESPVDRAWRIFKEREAEHEEAWEVEREAWGREKKGRRRDNPADLVTWEAAMAEIDQLQPRMFAAYDAWNRTRHKLAKQGQDELVTLTRDALTSTETGQHFSGDMQTLADKLYPILMEYDARDEHVGPPPFCPDCAEEMRV